DAPVNPSIGVDSEAPGAAALNRPRLPSVHDIGTHEGSPSAVSELRADEPLRKRTCDELKVAHRGPIYASAVRVRRDPDRFLTVTPPTTLGRRTECASSLCVVRSS